MARDYESRGFTNLFDFVERVAEMVELEEMEGEAPVNTGRDAVRLMTMHAAKGLEFPIVAIPSLHSPSRVSTEPFFDKDLGFGWNWRFNKDEFRPAIVALMGLNASERERAEEARLFYVAVTRARDMLILSGEYDRASPPSGTMLNWALAPFEEVPEENGSLVLRSGALGFLEADGQTERTEVWEQAVRFHTTIDDLPKYAPYDTPPVPFRAGAVRIGELPARAEGEIYSATQFMIYSQCPTKYYLKYRLGIPEEMGEAYDLIPDARDSEDATAFARTFRHAALALDRVVDGATGRLIADRDALGRTPLEATVDHAVQLEPLIAVDHDALRARVVQTFATILASAPARAVLMPEGARAFVDYQLTMPFGTEYLMGVIDRVLEHPDGTFSLVQFKTRRIERAALRRAAESYLPQLRVYAYLISALNPAQKSMAGTILFTEFPDEPQSFTFSRFEALRIEEELRGGIADIRALTYTGRRELPLRTPHCPDCPYWIEGACLLARAEEATRAHR
jgi:ATP-dependent helicase/nuclease subunit A